MTDQLFWTITLGISLVEAGFVCAVIEAKMHKMERQEKRAEKKRREKAHDYYCTKEVERLYNEGRYRYEGGFAAK